MVTISLGAIGPGTMVAAFTTVAGAVTSATPADAVRVRMRLFPWSAIQIVPSPSTVSPKGEFNWAPEAKPSSPEKPATPVPEIVVSVPTAVNWRMTFAPVSAISKAPWGPKAKPPADFSPSINVVTPPDGEIFATLVDPLTYT